jgi:lysophospholipase L1-like esterase
MLTTRPRVRSLAVAAVLLAAPSTRCQDAPPARVPDPKLYLADLTAGMDVQWPRNRTIRIACHGHSVPAGYFRTPTVDTFNAYPHLLHVALKLRHPCAVINVINTAIGGENSVQGAARFDEDVLSLRPDLITIDYGLNDRRVGVERARENLASMIDRAKARSIPVLLLTPTPDQGADLDDPLDPLNQQAAMIRELAAAKGVGLVDSLQAFRDRVAAGEALVDLMSQSNHPNRRGHDLVVAELTKWFPEPLRDDGRQR